MAKENEDGAEKTEEPTARKLEKAASEGQVARSSEVTIAACTIIGFLALLLGGGYFAEQLIEIFKGYFNEIDDDSIKDNFVIIYELLDEMMDNGYPQTTEFKILKQFIKSEFHKVKGKNKKKKQN